MLLEDRILRIIELKEQGFDSRAIAEKLELDENVINGYYNSTRVVLLKYKYSGKKLERIANEIGLSPISVNLLLNHYEINILSKKEITRINLKKSLPRVRHYGSKKENIEKIRQLANIGKNVSEIAKEIGLSEGTVRLYAYGSGIRLPKL